MRNSIIQLQLFQYEDTLQKLKEQLHYYENELSTSWQSQEYIPLQKSLQVLQSELHTCSLICEEIANTSNYCE